MATLFSVGLSVGVTIAVGFLFYYQVQECKYVENTSIEM